MYSIITDAYRKSIDFLRSKAFQLKLECFTLMHVYQDEQTRWTVKLLIGFTIAYALSPIDLIPDFIPVLGYLDDLILLPLLISLSVKLIPDSIYERSRSKARKEIDQGKKLKKNSWSFAILIMLIYVAIFFWLLTFFKKLTT